MIGYGRMKTKMTIELSRSEKQSYCLIILSCAKFQSGKKERKHHSTNYTGETKAEVIPSCESNRTDQKEKLGRYLCFEHKSVSRKQRYDQ